VSDPRSRIIPSWQQTIWGASVSVSQNTESRVHTGGPLPATILWRWQGIPTALTGGRWVGGATNGLKVKPVLAVKICKQAQPKAHVGRRGWEATRWSRCRRLGAMLWRPGPIHPLLEDAGTAQISQYELTHTAPALNIPYVRLYMYLCVVWTGWRAIPRLLPGKPKVCDVYTLSFFSSPTAVNRDKLLWYYIPDSCSKILL